MGTLELVCPEGHRIITFSNPVIEKLQSEIFTTGIQYPELYERRLEQAMLDALVCCDECNQCYPLTECEENDTV